MMSRLTTRLLLLAIEDVWEFVLLGSASSFLHYPEPGGL